MQIFDPFLLDDLHSSKKRPVKRPVVQLNNEYDYSSCEESETSNYDYGKLKSSIKEQVGK
jgi:hypothetical protein